MKKEELIDVIAENFGYTKVDAKKALTAVTESILIALRQCKTINLVGFGSFRSQPRSAREGHNPQTSEKIHIKAYNQPVFRAGKKMKECCNLDKDSDK